MLDKHIKEHKLTINRMLYNKDETITKIIDYFMHNDILDIYVYFNNYDYCEKYFELMGKIEDMIPNYYIYEFKQTIKHQTERYLKEYIKM